MRTVLTTLACCILASCMGAGGVPTGIAGVRTVITHDLTLLAAAVNREDPYTAAQPVSDSFVMGANVGTRYLDAGWTGVGAGAFRAYLTGVFSVHANVDLTLTLGDVQLDGDVATATVSVDFTSVRIDRTPPESFATGASDDYFVFKREPGAWRLIRWDVVPPPPPHDEGGGTS